MIAIGNIGYYKDVDVLERCAAEKRNNLESRIAALSAFRRFSCENFNKLTTADKILLDNTDDSEMRIIAFDSLARCPNSIKFIEFVGKDLVKFLKKEKDIQVKNFQKNI